MRETASAVEYGSAKGKSAANIEMDDLPDAAVPGSPRYVHSVTVAGAGC